MIRGVLGRAARAEPSPVPAVPAVAVLLPATAGAILPAPAGAALFDAFDAPAPPPLPARPARSAGIALALCASAILGFMSVRLVYLRDAAPAIDEADTIARVDTPAGPAGLKQVATTGRGLAPVAALAIGSRDEVRAGHVPGQLIAPAFSPAFSASGTALFFHTGGPQGGPSAIAMASSSDWSTGSPRIVSVIDDGSRNYHAQPSPERRVDRLRFRSRRRARYLSRPARRLGCTPDQRRGVCGAAVVVARRHARLLCPRGSGSSFRLEPVDQVDRRRRGAPDHEVSLRPDVDRLVVSRQRARVLRTRKRPDCAGPGNGTDAAGTSRRSRAPSCGRRRYHPADRESCSRCCATVCGCWTWRQDRCSACWPIPVQKNSRGRQTDRASRSTASAAASGRFISSRPSEALKPPRAANAPLPRRRSRPCSAPTPPGRRLPASAAGTDAPHSPPAGSPAAVAAPRTSRRIWRSSSLTTMPCRRRARL